MSEASNFIKKLKHPVLFRMFLFYKLPSAFFSGVRIRSIDEHKCVTSIPFKWLTQNPFKSTYFASLAMAAELSTGALAMAHLYKKGPVSMLVVKVEALYFKKAVGRTYFTCEEGDAFSGCIDTAISSGESQSFTAKSIGRNANDEKIAEFFITWSFKLKDFKK